MKKTLDEIAYENSLELISTTSESNGYPRNEKPAIIGFTTFQEAELIAKENGLEIQIFKRRDGWNFWYRANNTAFAPLERTAGEYGEDYMAWSPEDIGEYNKYAISVMREIIGDIENLDDMRELIDKYKRVMEKLEDAEEYELVITCNDDYYDTVDHYTMQYEYDTHHYAIGLIEA